MASVSAPLLRRLRRYIVERVQAGCSEAARILPMLPAARKAPKKKLPEHLRSTRPARKLNQLSTTGDVYGAVMGRAGGRCEACGREPKGGRLVMDHWLGGSGRRKPRESVETCWALCDLPITGGCNLDRTRNRPSAQHWNRLFESHCMVHGYPVPTLHVVHALEAK